MRPLRRDSRRRLALGNVLCPPSRRPYSKPCAIVRQAPAQCGATAPARAAPSPRVVRAVLPARLRAKRRAGFSLLVTPLDSLAGPFAGRSRPKPEMRSPPKRPARAKGAHVGDEAASDRGRQFYGPKRHGLEIGALTANSEIRPPRRREPRSGSSNAAGVSVPELPITGDCQRREQQQRTNFFRV
jgi:hypothetical protein